MKSEKAFSKDLGKLMKFPKEGIFSTVIGKSESHDFTLMCLSKGTEIGTHTSSKNGIVVVLKGKGLFVLQKKKIEMRPGIAIIMPKGAPHSLKARENLAILLLLVK